ncbi:transcription factor TFIIIB component B'' homolog [Bolinopsis microptera]|uniref:transcription factor TFIIIB component B'' homolog n=1 Tax=Bolinopsis microptera TaxID=2820187 RepID=UPI00307A113C
MPLLKGKFRPATKVARSRTNSTSEDRERSRSNSFSEFESQKRLPFNNIRTTGNTTLLPSQFSAFKIPASPIIVGLVSPSKQIPTSPGLYHASPRKTPTTPFSPRRPLSPHYIPTFTDVEISPKKHELDEQVLFKEPDQTSEEEIIPEAKKEEAREEIPTPDRLETISTTNDKDSSGSEYNDSDAQSVASYQGSDSGYGSQSKQRKVHPVHIDKSVMTISDIIKLRTPKDPDNPLTKVWKEIQEKEKRDKEMNIAKEQTRKDRIQQLIEEAKANGENLTENDIDEEELPPIEVQVDAVTGKIVVNETSLEVKMKSETGEIQETVEEDDAEISYGKYEDHKVSINSYSRRKQRKSVQWTEKENSRFYLALRKVGTDFDLMEKIMPEYTRDQLKRKFKREEKTRLAKIDMALSYSMRLDDELLEKEEPLPPKPKPKPVKRVSKKETLATKMARLNDLKRKSQSRKASVLSDSDDDYSPDSKKKPARKRQSRPLVIEDMILVRDESLDRKLVL